MTQYGELKTMKKECLANSTLASQFASKFPAGIIHNSHFKRRVSLEEQNAEERVPFLSRRQIAYLIYEYFRVTEANDSVENYANLFTIALRNDDIQEFDSKWDGILLSMTKIPPDNILEGLYKF